MEWRKRVPYTEDTSWSVPQHSLLVSTHCALRGSRGSCVCVIHSHPARAFSSCVFDVVAQRQVHSIFCRSSLHPVFPHPGLQRHFRAAQEVGVNPLTHLLAGPSWSVQKYFNSGRGAKGSYRAGKVQWSKTRGKEEKVKRKAANVTSEFAGAVGKQDTLRKIASRGVGTGV